jgi:hypothetical protein
MKRIAMAHAHVMVHRLIFVHPFHLHMVHVHSIGYLHLWMCSVVHAMMLMLCVGIKIYEKRCCDYYKYFFHHSSLSSVKLKGLCKKVYAARSRFFSRLPLISVLHFVVLATKVNTGLRLALYRVVKDLYLFVEEQAAHLWPNCINPVLYLLLI